MVFISMEKALFLIARNCLTLPRLIFSFANNFLQTTVFLVQLKVAESGRRSEKFSGAVCLSAMRLNLPRVLQLNAAHDGRGSPLTVISGGGMRASNKTVSKDESGSSADTLVL